MVQLEILDKGSVIYTGRFASRECAVEFARKRRVRSFADIRITNI